MNSTATEWTLDGFVDHLGFVHHKMLDHKFAWVLGAGASYASGIPVGSKLVDEWLREIHLKENGGKTPLETWATADTLGIVGFQYDQRAGFYPEIYQRRFREYPEEGYAYLESIMSGKDPGPGYSILASAPTADPPRHNVVVATNFDNLVADALSIYTDTFPFVCGHESLTAFVRVAMRRPLIGKIHRDLLLGPQNDSRIRKKHDEAERFHRKAIELDPKEAPDIDTLRQRRSVATQSRIKRATAAKRVARRPKRTSRGTESKPKGARHQRK